MENKDFYADVLRKLREAGLEELARTIALKARDSIRIERDEGSSGAAVPSKLGGRPDLPPTFAWPVGESHPLAFLAQFNLSEVAPLAEETGLPGEGALYVFYDWQQQPWGFEAQDCDGWRIVYLLPEDLHTLEALEPPAEDPEACPFFKEIFLRFYRQRTLPGPDSPELEALDLDDDDLDAYCDIIGELEEEHRPLHQFFGYPTQDQSTDMPAEAAKLASQAFPKTPPPAKPEGDEWVMLLQIDSDDEAGFMWGDMGRLHFWIRRDDLRYRRFERAWMFLLCG
ncbi:MAG TPA: YwqG family protein [Acidobacteriota bacterium]|nr:YwqG family protein [Acidobacteriota bacterium]